MTSAAKKTYVELAEPVGAPGLRALDDVITAVRPDADVAIKYRIVLYAADGDWRHWVCAVNAGKRGLCLRFLYGSLLSDPLHVLRAGTSTLMTWDMPFGGLPPTRELTRYVAEAFDLYPAYRADPRIARSAREALDVRDAVARRARATPAPG
jgi:hypothetical protein